jgi:hypothetical protein
MTGSRLRHLIAECSCYKGPWDGYGKDCQHCMRRANINETHTINESRGWCKTNATELLVKPQGADTAWGDFAADSYVHLYYAEEDFKMDLECEPLDHITSYKYFEGGTCSETVGADQGYLITKQAHGCFCGLDPCPHTAEIGVPVSDRICFRETPMVAHLRSRTSKNFAEVNRPAINRVLRAVVQSVQISQLLVVAGTAEDVDDEEDEDGEDCRFWLCVAASEAYKPGKTIRVDAMKILWNEWAVDVVWYTSLGNHRYCRLSRTVCTIPLATCIDCPGLKWESTTGNTSILSKADFQWINREWVSATKT